MKDGLRLYFLLLILVVFQVSLTRHSIWFPDLILLIVIFIGIFKGKSEGVLFGLAAGFLRGLFSIGTIYIDVALFPLIAVLSSLQAKMLYRQNPAGQIAITVTMLFFVIMIHTLFLNLIYDNEIAVSFVLLHSWRSIVATGVLAPLFFMLFKKILHCER